LTNLVLRLVATGYRQLRLSYLAEQFISHYEFISHIAYFDEPQNWRHHVPMHHNCSFCSWS